MLCSHYLSLLVLLLQCSGRDAEVFVDRTLPLLGMAAITSKTRWVPRRRYNGPTGIPWGCCGDATGRSPPPLDPSSLELDTDPRLIPLASYYRAWPPVFPSNYKTLTNQVQMSEGSRKGRKIARRACDLCRDRRVQVRGATSAHVVTCYIEHKSRPHTDISSVLLSLGAPTAVGSV